MRSLPILAAVLGITFAVPRSASADGQVCMVVPASDPTFLLPAERRELARAADGATQQRGEGTLLWCASADGPHCSPVHHEEQSHSEWLRGPLRCGGPDIEDVPAPAASDVTFVVEAAGPRAGVRFRIERPPRA